MNRGPDLLDWREPAPAGATLIPFPANKRVGKVRRTAAILLSKKSQRAQAAYWRQVEDGLASGLGGVGIPDDEISRQLGAFSEAVNLEAARLMHGAREQA